MAAVQRKQSRPQSPYLVNGCRSSWDPRARGATSPPESGSEASALRLKQGDHARRKADRRLLLNSYRRNAADQHAKALILLREDGWFPEIDPIRDSGAAQRLDMVRAKARRLFLHSTGAPMEAVGSVASLIDFVVDAHFQMGRILAPVYVHSNDTLISLLREWGYLNNSKFQLGFGGQDSLGQLIAYQHDRLSGPVPLPAPLHLPFSRSSLHDYWGPSPTVAHLRADLDGYYERRGLAKKKLVIVDFGFSGTIERIHRLLLSPQYRPSRLIHVLMFTEPNGVKNLKEIAGPGPLQDRIDFSLDRKQPDQIHSVFDAKLHQKLGVGFIDWLQDVASGVSTSQEGALRRLSVLEGGPRGTNDYAPESPLTLAARMAFLQGLHHAIWFEEVNPDHAEGALFQAAVQYEFAKPFFTTFTSQDSRENGTPEEQQLTLALLNAGMAPAFSKATLDTNWTQLEALIEREEDALAGVPIRRQQDRFTLR